MAIFAESWVVNVLVGIVTLLGILYHFFTSTYDYWKKCGVPYAKPTMLFGNIKDQLLMKKPVILVLDDVYRGLKGERFGGYFEARTPVLMIRDPELIERILIKDFSYFQNRDLGGGIDLRKDPLAGNLFMLKGQLWKNLRNKLTPTFTTGKLRGMEEQMSNCGDEILTEIEKHAESHEAVNAKALCSTFTIDVTASVAFGLQFKNGSPEGKQFHQIANSIFAPSLLRRIQFLTVIFFGRLAKLLNITFFPKKVTDYMINLVKTTMDYRKSNNIVRNDFLHLMMNLKEQEQSGKQMNWKSEISEEDAYLNQLDYSTNDGNMKNSNIVFTDECISAQSFVFLSGGSDAVANSLQFALYELAINPPIQSHLQQEVDSVLAKYNGKLTYEGLKEMHYLDLFVQERNRKYSEGGLLQRVCETPYLIPGSKVVIEKGTKVVIPVYSIHNDPAYYPEPEKFIPERFEGNNHRSSGKYLPFGDGPRICIAMRFVILEQKAGIAKIMSQYTVSLDPRTKVPLEYDPKSINFLPKDGIWVKFQKRTVQLCGEQNI